MRTLTAAHSSPQSADHEIFRMSSDEVAGRAWSHVPMVM
jgi:hypothetical protein